MTKAELLEQMAGDAEISKAAANDALNALIDGIISSLKTDQGKVTLTGFGTFSISHRKARKGRNPQTGKEIKIAASSTVKFKPGKKLKEAV